MPSAIEQRDVLTFQTKTGEVTITGWLHDDGEALTSIAFTDTLGHKSHRWLAVNDVERLVRGLQRWLAEVRENARSR